MGVLRGFGLVIISVLLFISILCLGIFATLSLSLNYENVQPKIYSVADQVIESQIGVQNMVNSLIPYLNVYCQTNTEIIQSFEGYTFVFPCSVVSEGYNSILNYSINYLVSDFYYKDYNCNFIKCLEDSEVPLFLVSDYAREFWKSLFFKFLIISLILIGLVILLAEKKSNAPLLVGSLFVVDSLIILSLNKIGALIGKAILSPISLALSKENTNMILSQIVGVFFSEASKVFLWMFVLGLILIAGAIVFKITGFGFKINKKIEDMKDKEKLEKAVTKEEVKEIVKKEVSKKKKTGNKIKNNNL